MRRMTLAQNEHQHTCTSAHQQSKRLINLRSPYTRTKCVIDVSISTRCVTPTVGKFLTFVLLQKFICGLNTEIMKTTKFLTTVLIASVVAFAGCNDSDPEPGPNNQVIPVQTINQATISLGNSSGLAILAGSSITNTGATNITGDIGLSPGTSIGGFPPGILTGVQHINDEISTQAKLDLTEAYNNAAGRTSTDIVTLSGNMGGLTLTPGLYKSTSSLAISSGDLTFDAKGDANAVFIIQIASTLTTTSGRKVFLSGGALASNIFWQVGSSATFGTTSVMKGTVMAMQSITFNTGATLEGKALARTGGITMAGNTIVIVNN
jgi:hypothetical protein